ncbi:Gp138 family membrane-puncturing spike protein [Levilactobacillus enshiensis]|uniref:Gp138 family membrane-puncturing spike protein n=1 Tax=Levilactobacillus enshiensis TaxID=2590213 RepID=UPI001179C2E6|nr:Gp138 family membrane-puncturing spike protein [Levilactobacillus enshiensis]
MTKKGKLQEDFHNLTQAMMGKSSYETNVSNFFEVVSYNASTHMADIQPQIDDEGGQDEVGIIHECPVLMTCYAFDDGKSMHKGSIVFAIYNDRDLDNFDGGKYTKASDRTHSVNDAVVVGVYKA